MKISDSSRDKIIRPVHRLEEDYEIPKRSLVVVGGSALELFGIKKTRDIDLVVDHSRIFGLIYECVTRDHKRRFWPEDGKLVDKRAYVTRPVAEYSSAEYGHLSLMVAPNDNLYQATFEELRDEAVDLEGVLVSPPERILEWKQAVGRSKDQADIQKTQDYLATITPTA